MVISRNFIIVYYPFISAICDASMYARIVDSKMQLNVIFILIFELPSVSNQLNDIFH